MKDIIFRIGGEGGEGVISTGELLTLTLGRAGLDIYTFRTYPAEIKGGHANYQIRAGDHVLLSQGDEVDVLVCFNQEAYDIHHASLRKGGVLVYDPEQTPNVNKPGAILYAVPLGKIAIEDVGFKMSKNIVCLGVLAQLFDIPTDLFEELLTEKFSKKGPEVLSKNIQALKAGHDYCAKNIKKTDPFRIEKLDRPRRLILSGNEAIALGAMVAGVKVYAGYPITPATDIMEFLARELPKVGGVVVQTEDEIAALGTVLGASFAGKKAMTATSGPGLSLMIEELGLATMAEIPVVVVDCQRAGPSTGMPTKTEQGDLNIAIFGGHGDSPRIVMALTSVEDCFYGMIRAFNLAEHYQMPVIVLSDQYLSHRKASVPPPDLTQVAVENRLRPTADELKDYRRYKLADNGVSPMAVPGVDDASYTATGVEHDERSGLGYSPELHRTMSAKRYSKLADLAKLPGFTRRYGDPEPDLAVIGWGSTEGVIREALLHAQQKGIRVAALHSKLVNPLPAEDFAEFLKTVKSRTVIVPEGNYQGQFGRLLRSQFGNLDVVSLTKCEGIPFRPMEILKKIEEVASHVGSYSAAV